MTCDRCGRLLNRATGRCVCDDYGGAAPTPVSVSHPPVSAPAAAPPAAPAPLPSPAPMSAAAAMAVLDLSDRPARPAPIAPATPAPPVAPPPPPRVPGAPVGVIRSARSGRARTDVVVYDGLAVLASRGAPTNLVGPQLAAQDPGSRLLSTEAVDEVDVREDALGGRATISLRTGETVVLTWSGRKNRGTAVENLLAQAFPGKVDSGPSQLARRTVRLVAGTAVGVLVLVGLFAGLSTVLRGGAPAEAPAAPPPTLAPAEAAARDHLQAACPPWQAFAGSVPAGERPDPASMRPVVDGIRGPFDGAAGVAGADAAFAIARDEVAYLQDYSRRTAASAGLESISRVSWAMRTVSSACTRAVSAP